MYHLTHHTIGVHTAGELYPDMHTDTDTQTLSLSCTHTHTHTHRETLFSQCIYLLFLKIRHLHNLFSSFHLSLFITFYKSFREVCFVTLFLQELICTILSGHNNTSIYYTYSYTNNIHSGIMCSIFPL